MRLQKALWTLAAVLALLGVVLLGVPGMRFSAALCCAAAVGLGIFAALHHLGREKAWAKWCARILLTLFCAGFAFFVWLEAQVVSGAHPAEAPREVACVVILGAGVDGTQPSVTLRSRLDAALDFLADKPDVPVIVSGSQGQGEDISEAECMARYLLAHGVEETRVWREERATSTRTNFAYSCALMAERGVDPAAGFAFVTSEYHIARAKVLAGTDAAYGVPTYLPEGAYYRTLTVNYYIREAFALANEMLFEVDWDL